MVFDDRNDIDYDVTMMVGDFNVAPDPDKDTLGYLHVNNPNTWLFMERMKSLNMLTDVFRHNILNLDGSPSVKDRRAIIPKLGWITAY